AKGRYNSVMARGDVVIANSRFTANLILRGWPEAASRIAIAPCGVDLAEFDPRAVAPERVAALRAAWGVAPHQRLILMPARMTRWKGHATLIEAAKKIVDAGFSEAIFILAGRGDEHERYVREL